MKIGIATAFSNMQDFYSLTTVILNQLRMILASGHTPILITLSDFNWDTQDKYKEFETIEVRKAIPVFTKIDYASQEDISEEHEMTLVPQIVETLRAATQDLDAILAHDLIFTGWNLPICLAIHKVATDTGPWFHWIHSVPSGSRDYWRLPPNSVLVYPNSTDRIQVAENYRTWQENVLVIPHCADLRDFAMTSSFAKKLITDYDVLGADLIQVYPIPTDRTEAKGIPWVIKMFGQLKKLGPEVRLVIPNAWCNVDKWRAEVQKMYLLGEAHGLTPKEMIFTSFAYPEHELGLPISDIKDLEMIGNIFICPTISETFGLSLAEAALMGSLLVLNDDLPMMKEICGGYGNAIWAKFSSGFFKTKHLDEKRYIRDISLIILNHMNGCQSMRSRIWYRKNYRREAVWSKLESAIHALKAHQALENA